MISSNTPSSTNCPSHHSERAPDFFAAPVVEDAAQGNDVWLVKTLEN